MRVYDEVRMKVGYNKYVFIDKRLRETAPHAFQHLGESELHRRLVVPAARSTVPACMGMSVSALEECLGRYPHIRPWWHWLSWPSLCNPGPPIQAGKGKHQGNGLGGEFVLPTFPAWGCQL